ncbi:EF-hand domain-containing protein [Rhizobium sp. P40RR-XXII]|uniref:EF-hand domain-containing protein n=1 Tax=Rhizobium sp. P40RR-XXII TaxID=2726739 RepID=UPI00145636F6|nr:EF-hand domain-containing protein [Rhizobium sp. P40RR-XXII]NLS18702.1 EF-hand domain-containing protein [Rhizobium sp. P40RR-XXII]
MRTTRISNAVLLAALIAIGGAGYSFAQTNETDPHHPANSTQAASPSATGGMSGQGEGGMPGSNMMPGDMMGRGMMQPGMMGGMPMMGAHGPIMKILFAIADTNGDGALSYEEMTAIHKRIFDTVDANNDGKVTPEEMQAFWR